MHQIVYTSVHNLMFFAKRRKRLQDTIKQHISHNVCKSIQMENNNHISIPVTEDSFINEIKNIV